MSLKTYILILLCLSYLSQNGYGQVRLKESSSVTLTEDDFNDYILSQLRPLHVSLRLWSKLTDLTFYADDSLKHEISAADIEKMDSNRHQIIIQKPAKGYEKDHWLGIMDTMMDFPLKGFVLNEIEIITRNKHRVGDIQNDILAFRYYYNCPYGKLPVSAFYLKGADFLKCINNYKSFIYTLIKYVSAQPRADKRKIINDSTIKQYSYHTLANINYTFYQGVAHKKIPAYRSDEGKLHEIPVEEVIKQNRICTVVKTGIIDPKRPFDILDSVACGEYTPDVHGALKLHFKETK